MSGLRKSTSLALVSAFGLAACGGSSVSNSGGFTGYETFADLAPLSADAQNAFDDFEEINGNGDLIGANPAANAVFVGTKGAVFRYGPGDATDVVYVGDFNALFNAGTQGISVTVDSIVNQDTTAGVVGEIGINEVDLNNGEFDGVLGGTDFFDGLNGTLDGAYVEYNGTNYIISVFQGSNAGTLLEGVGSGAEQ